MRTAPRTKSGPFGRGSTVVSAWLFLQSAVEAAVVERAGRAALDRSRDGACIGRVDDDPGPRLWNEDLRQPAHAVAHVDAEARLPQDFDRIARVRT